MGEGYCPQRLTGQDAAEEGEGHILKTSSGHLRCQLMSLEAPGVDPGREGALGAQGPSLQLIFMQIPISRYHSEVGQVLMNCLLNILLHFVMDDSIM